MKENKQLLMHFAIKYRKMYGKPCLVSWGKHLKFFNRLLEQNEAKKIERVIDYYFNTEQKVEHSLDYFYFSYPIVAKQCEENTIKPLEPHEEYDSIELARNLQTTED